MEALLIAAPAEPVDICLELAEWLELLGFKVALDVYAHADVDYLMATWRLEQGPRFYLEYTWGLASPAHGTTSLWVDSGHVTTRLAIGQPTATLGRAQQLLLGNDRFTRAYCAAHPDFRF